MIKLILSDMDGTLLDECGNMPPGFENIMEGIREKQIKFGVASGRQYDNLRRKFQKYENEMIFIAENGAFAVCQGREIFANPMDALLVKEILTIAEKIPRVHILLAGKVKAYMISKQEDFFLAATMNYTDYVFVENFDTIDDEILKIAIYDECGAEGNSATYFSQFAGRCEMAVAAKHWFDIMNFGVNKGTAVTRIQKYFDIAFDETMVFGDYLNDYEMMQSSYYSYAVENAHPKVKQIARFEAPSNRAYGVLKVISKEIIEKEKSACLDE